MSTHWKSVLLLVAGCVIGASTCVACYLGIVLSSSQQAKARTSLLDCLEGMPQEGTGVVFGSIKGRETGGSAFYTWKLGATEDANAISDWIGEMGEWCASRCQIVGRHKLDTLQGRAHVFMYESGRISGSLFCLAESTDGNTPIRCRVVITEFEQEPKDALKGLR